MLVWIAAERVYGTTKGTIPFLATVIAAEKKDAVLESSGVS